jgi:rhomboid protease GluP
MTAPPVEVLPSGPQNAPQFKLAVPKPPAPVVTNTIIAINLAVYLAMCVSGVSWIEPSSIDALRWGADFGPLTLGGEWWRLVTSTFVHFGLLHIGFNMWCLYNLGRSLEFLMGRKAFAATYLASGVCGSVVSICWHPLDIGAGASGAIFGVAGTFAAYLFLKRVAISPQAMKRTRNSIGGFIVYNLAFGAVVGRIDNSAHLGGLIGGAILGAIVPPVYRFRVRDPLAAPIRLPPNQAEQEAHANRIAWGIIFGSGIVLAALAFAVKTARAPYAQYGEAVSLITSGRTTQAVAVLRNSLSRGAKMPLTPLLLGEALLDQGNPKDAAAPLEAALASDSTDMQSTQNLALAYLGAGNSEQALREVAKVIASEKAAPGWDAVFIRGLAEGENNDFTLAIPDLEAARQANPSLAEAAIDFTRFQGLANREPESQLPPLAIPYSKLVVKSDVWPIFP